MENISLFDSGKNLNIAKYINKYFKNNYILISKLFFINY